jgi:hypothetical protein
MISPSPVLTVGIRQMIILCLYFPTLHISPKEGSVVKQLTSLVTLNVTSEI